MNELIKTERLVLRDVQFVDLDIYRNIRVRLAGSESFTPPPRPPSKDQEWWDENIASG
ncbi:MAG: RimJ/RimL family protein N-acetyltransferase, partial [Limisphaerales bacterium]